MLSLAFQLPAKAHCYTLLFCLGRDQPTIPAGVISDSVEWYGLLLQLTGTRAFIARPRLRAGAVSTSRAMLEVGSEVEPPDLGALTENTDTGALREHLGRLIGIGEYRHRTTMNKQSCPAPRNRPLSWKTVKNSIVGGKRPRGDARNPSPVGWHLLAG